LPWCLCTALRKALSSSIDQAPRFNIAWDSRGVCKPAALSCHSPGTKIFFIVSVSCPAFTTASNRHRSARPVLWDAGGVESRFNMERKGVGKLSKSGHSKMELIICYRVRILKSGWAHDLLKYTSCHYGGLWKQYLPV
jgi:hypothetical protein